MLFARLYYSRSTADIQPIFRILLYNHKTVAVEWFFRHSTDSRVPNFLCFQGLSALCIISVESSRKGVEVMQWGCCKGFCSFYGAPFCMLFDAFHTFARFGNTAAGNPFAAAPPFIISAIFPVAKNAAGPFGFLLLLLFLHK